MEQTTKPAQNIMPYKKNQDEPNGYDIFPAFKLGDGEIFTDMEVLADKIKNAQTVIVDGYVGVDFNSIRQQIEKIFNKKGVNSRWVDVEQAMLPEDMISQLIEPFMGEQDSIFGTRTTLDLSDYFDPEKLHNLLPDATGEVNVIYGTGAKLSGWDGLLIYIDLPKNVLQSRSRAGKNKNLGATRAFDMKTMYKRFYFIDWIVLNRHKKEIAGQIDLIVDGQHDDAYVWMTGDSFRKGLTLMSNNFFRARPWFEPGVWGGSWMKEKIEGVDQEAQNYAWSFELITPENGVVFESSSNLLEVSFDFLLYVEGDAVLGVDQAKFGDEFPLRFDFLDTFDGGNLSVQCHPLPAYCKEQFGENLTQEETYYILDKKNDAVVYLGFQDNIEPEKFEKELWKSYETNTEIEVEKFVRVFPAHKHDLFLIPPGTIHGSGIDNLVLEISTTPYIFTFKLYDWVRPDLNGKPRPLNIVHGMRNLDFERKGKKVEKELISSPLLIQEGDDWQKYELPTHEKHSYRVQRYHFKTEVKIETGGKFNVLSLVEGTSVTVVSEKGRQETFRYVETFVVPAAANWYIIKNNSDKEAMVVVAFMK